MNRSLIAAVVSAAIAAGVASAQAPPRVILLVGPPGSGKTTQAKLLAKKYGVASISMADLLKKQMAPAKDRTSRTLAATIASGEAMPDQAAADLIRLALQRADHSKGVILDGFPASAGQAKALDRILQDERLPKAVVVVLDVPDDVIRKRMLVRRRADDKPENIDRRIREFRDQAALLIGWAAQTQVVRVDATGSVSAVSKKIVAGLEDAWSKQAPNARP